MEEIYHKLIQCYPLTREKKVMDHLCVPFRNDALIRLAFDCVYTAYKDSSFNLVVVWVIQNILNLS